MFKKILKYLLIGSGSLATIAVIIAVGMYNNIIRIPIQMTWSHTTYSADYSTPENLMGGYHNVFVGKVIKKSGERILRNIMPKTQFSVEVLYNVKGNLSGNIIVDQEGGYFRGMLTLPENQAVLSPGVTYLFATRGNGEAGWYVLGTNPYALKVINTDSSLSIAKLEELARENQNIKNLEIAYPNEILEKSDIMRNTTRNSFQSLPPEAKAAAVARADAARAWLETNKAAL